MVTSLCIRRPLEVFRSLCVVQRQKQIHAPPRVHPIEDGFSLRRDLGHFRLVHRAPIPIEVEAVRVEAHANARDAVGIAEREDFEDRRPAHLGGDRIRRK
jgi:hypothetical protein